MDCGGESEAKYETVAWPYDCDESIVASEAGKAFIAELAAAEKTAREEARIRAREDHGQKKIAAAKLKAEKEDMGGEWRRITGAGSRTGAQFSIRRAGRAIRAAKIGWPSSQWTAASRADWIVISPPRREAKAGISPRPLFQERPSNSGADYYSGKGRKNATRWYGFVVAVSATAILLRESATGKAAIKAGEEFAKTHTPVSFADAK